MKSKKAFTLIELLVVIAIIGLLATISVIALNNARAKARDAKRVADIKQVQTVLELFFNDEGRYPTAAEFNSGSISSFSSSTNSTTTYMAIIPAAANPPDGNCNTGQNRFGYSASSDGTSYTLSFCLGGTTGSLASGSACATPAGIANTNCMPISWACGDTVQYDGGLYDGNGISTTTGGYYRTVLISSQCWFKDNLNAGSMILGANDQTSTSTIEKYCYNNDLANCATYGGLYQWSEATQFYSGSFDFNGNPIANVQGICPAGWHIPSDAEQNVLDQYLTDPPNPCVSNRGQGVMTNCANAGTKLQAGGSSGFAAPIAGYRNTTGSFDFLNSQTFIWSSSVDSPGNNWNRYLDPGYSAVGRWLDPTIYGFSVRCLKD